ncbi:telomeric repeat-binding factor 2-interacting protein 1 [Cyclopterus lumpus]|uniref:telomeric repeat-binding factor 2-interacting protein 1 n=1 Tax=Cyclopterus lumpus TaxID=8103 RepID=UPI00148617A5|nr:telomeric repeat-binding factor 2-interacting protein 1 [Cyclopterus lumpus]XP_034389607.1 telomeric repeat-binding factor 2-interacting protein 1 [Cyclopterus lumpus]
MQSKKQDVAKPNISPVLFMTVDGEPMSFFLPPGPVKSKLQPLITAGAGLLNNVQQPGAILLIPPEERGIIPENRTHWYVSTQYILDCIEKDEQLDLEDYRLHCEVVPRQSPRLNNNKHISTGLSGGRVAYTAEEDAAILSYVSKHKTETKGNRLWQKMEKQRVTTHSWQSMKYHYQVPLAKRHSEVVEVATTEEDTKAAESETKVQENQKIDVPKNSNGEDSPPMNSTETDLKQIGAQSTPSESRETEVVEAQTSIPPQEEVQHVDPQTDKQPAESTEVETVEAETCNSEGSCLDAQTDAQPVSAECAEPEMEEPQTIISPPKKSVPGDSPSAEPESLPDTSSQKESEEKQKASPKPEQLQRRFTRRRLVVDVSSLPEPYGKQVRSSTTSPGRLSLSPQPSKKTKAANKSNLQTDTTEDQPPSKRARGKSVAESQAAVPETAQEDRESNSVPQKGEKKKEKRKLGILEMATKEFEDGSDSDEDGSLDLQNLTETATVQPTSTEPPLRTSDTASDVVSTPSNPEHGPIPQENMQVAEASSSTFLPKTGCPEPAANEAVNAASKAHLFIFDSESQEDSQSIIGDNPVALSKPQSTVNKDAALSLTQVQLEEDKQRIKALMNQTNQDLVSVTKALLKTSGDFSAALEQLLNPSSISGPVWNRCDDGLLFSADPVVRQQLQEKYSEEDVAKRIVFLEVER